MQSLFISHESEHDQAKHGWKWRQIMWRTCIGGFVTPIGIAIAMGGSAAAQDTVKVGMVMPLTGTLASAGKQVVAGARLYVSQHGAMVAGKEARAGREGQHLVL